MMKFATVRNLKNQTSEMLRLAAKGTDVLITSHGKPVAMLHGLGEEDVEDFVLSRHHGLRKSIEDAEREYRKRGGVPLAEVVSRPRTHGVAADHQRGARRRAARLDEELREPPAFAGELVEPRRGNTPNPTGAFAAKSRSLFLVCLACLAAP